MACKNSWASVSLWIKYGDGRGVCWSKTILGLFSLISHLQLPVVNRQTQDNCTAWTLAVFIGVIMLCRSSKNLILGCWVVMMNLALQTANEPNIRYWTCLNFTPKSFWWSNQVILWTKVEIAAKYCCCPKLYYSAFNYCGVWSYLTNVAHCVSIFITIACWVCL